ncbi:aspartate aminotransferase family protein [Litorilinea aerophila]|uniref:Aspartate aminotransferase family protein n=1 Tax=Litorilinea aerophila TaxID=1204385 RepID=A0A540VML0_9CHLR|nr:aspartate aminotransferase family protein [Litorilinea aerophila]MCC9074715.1 aspartate aminotransferase family protein [Litorilinea aerophila]OUC09619.1 acetylornithine aminotransferase [Litorilinea aerophila]GIV75891.1 MAG: acetylornithine aminotransferase [Litorilinea sp.]
MDKQEIIEMEQSYVLGVYSRPPFVLERGEGCTLYDTDGKAYLDCVSGIAVNALGYGDAGINQAIAEAAATGILHVSNLYHTAPHARLAKLLCETSFADKVHFSLSGADANEGAFKFARRYAREKGHQDKYHILAFSNAFHGRLFGSLAATPRPKYQEPFEPLMPGVRFAEFNNLESARAQMDEQVCAIIVEPIQGEGGIHPATPEFLRGLRALADEYDALLIYDEVQCGVGRTGTLWAYQGYADGDEAAVAPDILTAAKPLAGGLPIGAILMRQKVADAMHKGDHASTFAGNPFTTHVAHHVVSRIADPQFLAGVQRKGKLFVDLLEELNSPHIQEIRGKGLLIGVEMDMDVTPLISQAYEEGLILVNAGPTVLRFIPPLIISEAEIQRAVETVGKLLQRL